MRCTDKRKIQIAGAILCAVLLSGCGASNYKLTDTYDVYGTQIQYVSEVAQQTPEEYYIDYFSSDLCVGEDTETGTRGTISDAAEAVGVFHEDSGEITCSKNIYQKMYPASTTKILTAYLALKYGNLADTVTVSARAVDQASDSSICYLREGDQLTLETLLYGLLLKSGNDAAVAVAEHISGNVKEFADLMNREAALLGATRSHFVNPHGLQDEEHYTCVYDLYLLLHAALEYDEFRNIIHTPKYSARYVNANNEAMTQEWETTDRFLNGEAAVPEGITVIGGKTGTTSDAGYCLALCSENAQSESVISIVLKADSRDHLYQLMAQMLEL